MNIKINNTHKTYSILKDHYSFISQIENNVLLLNFGGTSNVYIACDIINGFFLLFKNYYNVNCFEQYFNDIEQSVISIEEINITAKSFGGIISHYFIVSMMESIEIFSALKKVNISIFGGVGVHNHIESELLTRLCTCLDNKKNSNLEINFYYTIHSYDVVCMFFNPFIFSGLTQSKYKTKHNIVFVLEHLFEKNTEYNFEFFSSKRYIDFYTFHRYNAITKQNKEIVYKQCLRDIVEYYKPYLKHFSYLRDNSMLGLYKFIKNFYSQYNFFNTISNLLLCNFNSINSGAYGVVNLYVVTYYMLESYRRFKNTLISENKDFYSINGIGYCNTLLNVMSYITYFFIHILYFIPFLRTSNIFLVNFIIYLSSQSIRIFELIYFFCILIYCSILRYQCLKFIHNLK